MTKCTDLNKHIEPDDALWRIADRLEQRTGAEWENMVLYETCNGSTRHPALMGGHQHYVRAAITLVCYGPHSHAQGTLTVRYWRNPTDGRWHQADNTARKIRAFMGHA